MRRPSSRSDSPRAAAQTALIAGTVAIISPASELVTRVSAHVRNPNGITISTTASTAIQRQCPVNTRKPGPSIATGNRIAVATASRPATTKVGATSAFTATLIK